jgi:uncharacterized protein
MKKIFKYPIEVVDEQVLVLPLGAKVLSAIAQGDDLVVYALVEPIVEFKKNVEIRIAGTGHEIAFDLQKFKFLNSISMYGGRLIWHVFYAE